MKRSEQEKLLKGLLRDENLDGFREGSLERGLASMRRHRRRCSLFRAGALAGFVCVLTMGLFLKDRKMTHNNIAVSSPSTASSSDKVKFISDDELLAMFPKGSVALIGKPGQQRLVFLDRSHGETPGSSF